MDYPRIHKLYGSELRINYDRIRKTNPRILLSCSVWNKDRRNRMSESQHNEVNKTLTNPNSLVAKAMELKERYGLEYYLNEDGSIGYKVGGND